MTTVKARSKQVQPLYFISYLHGVDGEWVREFASYLRESGVRVWLDETEIRPGESWVDALEAALRSSDVGVSVMTPQGVSLPNMAFEIGAAVGLGKALAVIVPDGIDSRFLPGVGHHFTKQSPKKTASNLVKAAPLAAVG